MFSKILIGVIFKWVGLLYYLCFPIIFFAVIRCFVLFFFEWGKTEETNDEKNYLLWVSAYCVLGTRVNFSFNCFNPQ